MSQIPTGEGFFWAKWKIATEGTDTCRKCGHENSCWERDGGPDEWEIVQVVENTTNKDDDEHLMVQVLGVSRWQPLDCFYWGEEVPCPHRQSPPPTAQVTA
jgi:hypothetical protein